MWSKDGSSNFKFIVYSYFEKSLEKWEGEIKHISEIFFEIHFHSVRLS